MFILWILGIDISISELQKYWMLIWNLNFNTINTNDDVFLFEAMIIVKNWNVAGI